MALNKTLPGLALLWVQSSTLDPKSAQIPFHTPQTFFLAASTQQLITARDFYVSLICHSLASTKDFPASIEDVCAGGLVTQLGTLVPVSFGEPGCRLPCKVQNKTSNQHCSPQLACPPSPHRTHQPGSVSTSKEWDPDNLPLGRFPYKGPLFL